MTTLIAAVCMLTPQVKEAVQGHPGFLLAAFVLSFAILIGLYVKRRESPINLILLAAFVRFNIFCKGSLVTCYINYPVYYLILGLVYHIIHLLDNR